MYGTIARFRVKPGMEEQLMQVGLEEQAAQIPGWIAQYVYRMDANPNEYYLVVIFESKEAYIANAGSPEQDARYRTIRALLEDDPDWHDGEIVAAGSAR
jgi:quinol monooxygenase YgiN